MYFDYLNPIFTFSLMSYISHLCIFSQNLRLMKHSNALFFSLVMIIFASGCEQSATTSILTLAPPDQTGIHFANRIAENDTFNILSYEYIYNGGGVGIGDFNQDGLQDLFFSANTADNQLYLNKGDFQFEDVTEKAGVAGKGRWCSGVAVGDINGDGWLDIYVAATAYQPGARRKNLLFINQQSKDTPLFKEMGEAYGLADTTHSINAALLDYDRDGDLDLYLLVNEMEYDHLPNKYRPKIKDGSSVRTDKFFRNDWNEALGHPVFTDVSKEAGILIEGYALGVNVCDMNQDGWPDIYVTNDYVTNDLLWINNGDGTFTDRAEDYMKHTCYSAMGNDIADINNDGLADIVALDMLPEDNYRRKTMLPPNNYYTYLNNDRYGYQYQYMRNVLQLNQGKNPETGTPLFSETAMLAGISSTDWSWSPLLADIDNDGYRDLLVTNGFPRDVTDRDFMDNQVELGPYMSKEMLLEKIPSIKIKNYAYRNRGGNVPVFEDASTEWGFNQTSFSSGAAYADFDNDGDLDYVVNNINDSAFVFRNQTIQRLSDKAHWLKVKLAGDDKNTHGLGAKIELYYGKGQHQYWENTPFRGYLSSVEPGAHFGVGKVTTIDELIVTWPDGRVQRVQNIPTNQVIQLAAKEATIPTEEIAERPDPVFQEMAKLLGIDFMHKDSNFIDFNIQRLLPHKLSQYGPSLAVGDVNGDGLDDFYIGGAHFHKGTFFIQETDAEGRSTFRKEDLLPEGDGMEEELGVLFFDVDQDGDNDLYLVSGGNEFPITAPSYQDRLYLNEGGRFQLAEGALPTLLKSGSCVRAADFDRDGDLDLFVGGRVQPAEYPKPVSSYLLRNDTEGGQVKFSLVNESQAPMLNDIGMVCDAVWSDHNQDGWVDLVLAGEFMPITILENKEGQFEDVTTSELSAASGWWNSLTPVDYDMDGDVDFVAGNLGLNSLLKADETRYIAAYGADFDGNRGFDIIPSAFFPDREGNPREFPYFQRVDMEKQVIKVKKLYPKHREFGEAEMKEVLSHFADVDPLVLKAKELRTSLIENLGNGQYQLHALPLEAQTAPVFGIVAEDFNGDGIPDLLLSGNDYGAEVGMGRYDAFNGLLLIGDGKGNFSPQSMQASGIHITGDGKSLATLVAADGSQVVLAGQNQGKLQAYRLRKNVKSVSLKTDDCTAVIRLKDGRTIRQELTYGQGFQSQSTRRLFLPVQAERVEVINYRGEKRRVE